MAVVVQGGVAFWISSFTPYVGAVSRISTDGGAVTTLVSGMDALELVVDDTHVYWTDTSGQGFVQKIPLSGGEKVDLASGFYDPFGLGIVNERVYFVAGDGSLMSVSKTGGDQRVEVSREGRYGGGNLVTTASHVYWVVLDYDMNKYEIVSAAFPGLEPIVVASQGNSIGEIAVNDTYLFWADMGSGGGATDGRIMRMRLDDRSITALAADVGRAAGITVDAGHVYWTNIRKAGTGTVGKVPIEGSEVTILADCLDGPNDIAVDDTHVYWTNLGGHFGGSLMRTPK